MSDDGGEATQIWAAETDDADEAAAAERAGVVDVVELVEESVDEGPTLVLVPSGEGVR